MSTSTVLVNQKQLTEGKRFSSTLAAGNEFSFSRVKQKALLQSTWRHVLDTALSSSIIFLLLTLYIVSGMHGWWSALVAEFIKAH
jgi:hypothetical protein